LPPGQGALARTDAEAKDFQWEGDPIELTIAWVIVMAGVIGLAALLAPGSPDEADPSRSEKERAQIHW